MLRCGRHWEKCRFEDNISKKCDQQDEASGEERLAHDDHEDEEGQADVEGEGVAGQAPQGHARRQIKFCPALPESSAADDALTQSRITTRGRSFCIKETKLV